MTIWKATTSKGVVVTLDLPEEITPSTVRNEFPGVPITGVVVIEDETITLVLNDTTLVFRRG